MGFGSLGSGLGAAIRGRGRGKTNLLTEYCALPVAGCQFGFELPVERVVEGSTSQGRREGLGTWAMPWSAPALEMLAETRPPVADQLEQES